MLDDFISLIFPGLCAACEKALFRREGCICTWCTYHLPKTNFHTHNDNPVAKIFWGRINIHSAASFYLFNKGGKVQRLVHQLKYKGQKEVGVALGRLYGFDLKKSKHFSTVDAIIPVPLHARRKRKRGYNQSEFFALGLSESMRVSTYFNSLYRPLESATQTRKSKFARWQNVESVFQLRKAELLKGKHILLVDDVITTGATLEACAAVLLKVPGVRVSVATIAYSGN